MASVSMQPLYIAFRLVTATEGLASGEFTMTALGNISFQMLDRESLSFTFERVIHHVPELVEAAPL
jgi:hypothetical protein